MTSHAEPSLTFSEDELLGSRKYDEPLIAGGVRCHGGFDEDGRYHSPRTLHRTPAISAWQDQLLRSGHDVIEISRALMPPQYPNVEQAKLLLRHGVRDPMVRSLTIISIVEGFGAVIRDVRVPELAELIVEPIDGTALSHLRHGLFEAHARDEAGYEDEGGHKQMWEAARDLALEHPKIPGDVLMRLMGRRSRAPKRERPFPQLDEKLERMLAMMAQVLVIEVFAEGTFQWGIDVLSDPEVSAEPQAAGDMVRYIQSDESPHVEYLRTALSEVRARTLRTVDGKQIAGCKVVDGLLHDMLHNLTRNRPREQREDVRESMIAAMQDVANPTSLEEEYESLASAWTAPAQTGFEPSSAA
ncbi:MAG: hypothetical protein JRH01_00915 [Deltaproteobacteria bacterium]|nr:hypothetical protein [Deltaproteobacteria bacterium]MBW2392864.1 hypothetical protein [Deltaproteobacteria bacterium]